MLFDDDDSGSGSTLSLLGDLIGSAAQTAQVYIASDAKNPVLVGNGLGGVVASGQAANTVAGQANKSLVTIGLFVVVGLVAWKLIK